MNKVVSVLLVLLLFAVALPVSALAAGCGAHAHAHGYGGHGVVSAEAQKHQASIVFCKNGGYIHSDTPTEHCGILLSDLPYAYK